MFFFTYRLFHCISCSKLLFFRMQKHFDVVKAHSGLGPASIQCPRCGAVMATDDLEWNSMDMRSKVYLWILTLGYSAVIGLMLSLMVLALLEKLTGAPENSLLTTPALISGAIVFGGIFVLLQLLRVLASIQRTEKPKPEPVKATFFNLYTNFQSIGMGAIILSMILAFVAYFI